MEKLEQLFIRACKSKDPQTRVRSVYRRYYVNYTIPEPHIINILAKICDKYVPMKVTEMIYGLHPDNRWINGNGEDEYNYTIISLNVLINKIRFSETNKFPGITSPAMFRKTT
jgi:hypothetical protein